MPSSKPRTRENFPNQKITVGSKVRPFIFDWIDKEILWKIREKSNSGVISQALEFAYSNEEAFIQFCTQSKDKVK
ncbi:hypothetical protein RBG61_06570 [Paludicola sp. MB14-C6]|uniref:hypothetical protein n=1 Tax=Paludihabitans sp. MB14-C6 TaxID=3070656 RepID=UPI0027DDD2AA|nr:hypothetical protein [Paludicola sp. MB14-C6]WMJ24325.1 hypothetical protein RBG61_06570 [Paludicola sp. MB14-C6]